MKKITIAFAMILTLVVNSFANDEKINPEVLTAFKTRFADAQDVTIPGTGSLTCLNYPINKGSVTISLFEMQTSRSF